MPKQIRVKLPDFMLRIFMCLSKYMCVYIMSDIVFVSECARLCVYVRVHVCMRVCMSE